jgi:small subunit ribosomal protein S2
VDVPIPGNDDALRAIRLFAGKVADAVLAGRALREAQLAETVAGGPAEPGRRVARPVTPAPAAPAAPGTPTA